VGEGDGEEVGDAVRPVVVGPVEGTGVVVGLVRSVRGGGSYGPLSAADIAVATTTTASTHVGASTTTRGTRTNGCTHPSKTYHNSAANTTTIATDSHHGKPRMNGPPKLCQPPYRRRSSLRRTCRLDRRVCDLQFQPQRVVVGVSEIRAGLALEGGELRRDVREVTGKVLGGVPVVEWSSHAVRIREKRRFPKPFRGALPGSGTRNPYPRPPAALCGPPGGSREGPGSAGEA
jgi:hypothetical protein